MTAAAEGPVTFGYFFYRWKARLCGWRGSSSAQGVGGRVRTPAPMADSEALSFFRRGALCAPAGGQRPPLRRKTDRERWLANSGADLEPHQGKILQTQGPVARRELRVPLRFCAPEILLGLAGMRPP